MPTRVQAAAINHDRRDGVAYVTDPRTELAVDVALATGRPLLLRGEPGSGKSSLAAHVAHTRGWRYYEHVVTSRTHAEDFLWSFDHVRRLADATAAGGGRQPLNDHEYVTPGVLWWAFDPESARRRGAPATATQPPSTRPDEPRVDLDTHPGDAEHTRAAGAETRRTDGADRGHTVVLIDEIDKADPDTPNGLLVPLGSRQFTVTETQVRVRDRGVTTEGSAHRLVVITTNGERELPSAFLRRCVVSTLPRPDAGRLLKIAERHLRAYERSWTAHDRQLAKRLADELVRIRERADEDGIRPPSTAEYLDALYACRELGIMVDDDRWEELSKLTLTKEHRSES